MLARGTVAAQRALRNAPGFLFRISGFRPAPVGQNGIDAAVVRIGRDALDQPEGEPHSHGFRPLLITHPSQGSIVEPTPPAQAAASGVEGHPRNEHQIQAEKGLWNSFARGLQNAEATLPQFLPMSDPNQIEGPIVAAAREKRELARALDRIE